MPEIEIDTSQLTYPVIEIPEADSGPIDGSRATQSIVTLPTGTDYHLQLDNGLISDFSFAVTEEGTLDFAEACDSFLHGRGGRRLTVRGMPVQIDASALDYPLRPQTTGLLSPPISDHTYELSLVPASGYRLGTGDGISGYIDFDFSLEGYVELGPETVEFATAEGNTLTILGVTINIDGRALSHDLLPLNAAGAGYLPRATVNQLTVLPGNGYMFQAGPGVVADFRYGVAPDGTVLVDPAFTGFASAAGSTLKLKGHTINIDGRKLSHDVLPLGIAGEGKFLPRATVNQLTVLPAKGYNFQPGLGTVADFSYGVTRDGKVSVDPPHTGTASVSGGGGTLKLHGHLINIDGRKLSHDLLPLGLAGDGKFLPRDTVNQLTVLPANGYGFQPGSGVIADFWYAINRQGQVLTDPIYDGFTSASGHVLKIRGYTINVDGRQLSHDLLPLGIQGDGEFLPRNRVNQLTIIPASGYGFQPTKGIVADFDYRLTVQGDVEVHPRYGGFASVQDSTLTITGNPVEVDAKALSHDLLLNVTGNEVVPAGGSEDFRLLPAKGYSFFSASGILANFSFGLDVTGLVLIDPRYTGFSRADRSKLRISGYTIIVDGTSLSFDLRPLLLGWTGGDLSHTTTHEMTLIPGAGYVFLATDGSSREFQVTLEIDGSVSVSPTGPDVLLVKLKGAIVVATATTAGTPTTVVPPAILSNLPDQLRFDSTTGWPPRLPSTSGAVDVRPSPVSFNFSDWTHYLTVALAHPEVKSLLQGSFVWLGCHLLGTRNPTNPMQVLVCLRNPSTGQIIDVRISGNSVESVTTKEPWEHPESPSEMAAAIDMVKNHPKHAPHIVGLQAHAIVRVPNDPKIASYRHRCMYVMFTKPEDPHVERLVCYAVLVDLDTQTIVAARSTPCS
ncbi:hypothetical protein [Streptomyces galilaeus]|uniref:hypothetical protein n=1 Tax=Streptomyces galilaeus TaxID=33899 RepID=UPI00167866BB|nr:hypothetical protein [Streptomyces galilaeus]GGW87837.1 hypothetical protein GCM10010350_84930 [Streptomyces galilaeus]